MTDKEIITSGRQSGKILAAAQDIEEYKKKHPEAKVHTVKPGGAVVVD